MEDPSEPGCVKVGSAFLVGSDIAHATAEKTESSASRWIVSVTVFRTDRSRVNAGFNACYHRSPLCPTAAIAIVIDGKLANAPTVTAENLGSEAFDIAPFEFSKAQAQTVAAGLNH